MAKHKKQEILNEAVQTLANLNIIEELMDVHQGNKPKDEVINKHKDEFNHNFARTNEQEEIIKASNEVIMKTFPSFKKVKQSFAVDPVRQ